LFLGKGYEQTSVQDIINQIGVAKGTFYHYFDSKVDLLDAVVQRILKALLAVVMPIVENPEWDALTKLEHFFRQASNWKMANHEMVLDTARKLYKDENVILLLKVFHERRQSFTTPLAAIIEQGVAEGVLKIEFPRETAELILHMSETPSSTLVAASLDGQFSDERISMIARELHVFNTCVKRVLGMAENSIDLVNDAEVSEWLSVLKQISTAKAV
jgi:AcrR family transcriptional regulator